MTPERWRRLQERRRDEDRAREIRREAEDVAEDVADMFEPEQQWRSYAGAEIRIASQPGGPWEVIAVGFDQVTIKRSK